MDFERAQAAEFRRLIAAVVLGLVSGIALTCVRQPLLAAPEPIPVRSAVPPAAPAEPISTPQPGSLMVLYRNANGQEYTLLCGGEISLTPECTPPAPSSDRSLLRLDRQ